MGSKIRETKIRGDGVGLHCSIVVYTDVLCRLNRNGNFYDDQVKKESVVCSRVRLGVYVYERDKYRTFS